MRRYPFRTSRRAFAPATLGLLLVVLATSGCSMYRVHAPGHPGVADRSDVVWSYAWGLAPGIPEVDCQGQALAEVTVTSHFGYDLLSVVTLGLVSPKKIEWKCAGATPDEGTIPTGSPAPSLTSDEETDGEEARDGDS